MTIRRRYTMMMTGATEATLDACLPEIRKPRLTKDGAFSLSHGTYICLAPVPVPAEDPPRRDKRRWREKYTADGVQRQKSHHKTKDSPFPPPSPSPPPPPAGRIFCAYVAQGWGLGSRLRFPRRTGMAWPTSRRPSSLTTRTGKESRR